MKHVKDDNKYNIMTRKTLLGNCISLEGLNSIVGKKHLVNLGLYVMQVTRQLLRVLYVKMKLK